MNLVKFKDHEDRTVYLNPKYVVGIAERKTQIGMITGTGTAMDVISEVHMTNMDANRVKGTAEEIAEAFGYVEEETPEAT